MLSLILALNVGVPIQDFTWRGTPKLLRTETIIGDVTITRATGREVVVTAVKRAGRHGNPEDVTIKVREQGGEVTICVQYPGRVMRSGDDGPCRRGGPHGREDQNDTVVDFTVQLPTGVEMVGASITGDVVATGVRGPLEVTSVSGSVRVERMIGEGLEATSVSGDVTLLGIQAKRVSGETVSGNVRFEGVVDPNGRLDLQTLSGNVVATLPEGLRATVHGSTFSGSFSSDFPVTRESSRRRQRINGTIGGGGGIRIELETFSGNIRLVEAR